MQALPNRPTVRCYRTLPLPSTSCNTQTQAFPSKPLPSVPRRTRLITRDTPTPHPPLAPPPQITLFHLSTITAIVQALPDHSAVPLITTVEGLVRRTYGGSSGGSSGGGGAPLSMGAQHLLRQTLLRFFQDKRVKVSLFLQVRGIKRILLYAYI